MGLLDFNDPQVIAGLGLLSGQQVPQALVAMQAARGAQERNKQSQLQLEQMQKQIAEQEQMRQLAQRFQTPGSPGIAPGPDGMGPSVAPTQPGFDLQGYANAMMGIDPMKGLALQAQLGGGRKQPKYHNVGGALVPEPDEPGQQVKPVYEAPREQWVDAGRDPKTGQQLQKNSVTGQLKAVGSMPPSMSVNMPKLESLEQGEKGRLNIKNLGEMQTAAQGAQKENSLLSALEKNPIDTSKATPLTATAAAWLAPLGGERMKEYAANAQKFQAGAMEMVLNKQMLQKGPQTESDARRLEQTVAQLGNTKEANNAIIAFGKAQNNRAIAQHRFYNEYWGKHKTLEGADQAWMDGPGAKSLWDDPALSKLAPAKGGWSITEVK